MNKRTHKVTVCAINLPLDTYLVYREQQLIAQINMIKGELERLDNELLDLRKIKYDL